MVSLSQQKWLPIQPVQLIKQKMVGYPSPVAATLQLAAPIIRTKHHRARLVYAKENLYRSLSSHHTMPIPLPVPFFGLAVLRRTAWPGSLRPVAHDSNVELHRKKWKIIQAWESPQIELSVGWPGDGAVDAKQEAARPMIWSQGAPTSFTNTRVASRAASSSC